MYRMLISLLTGLVCVSAAAHPWSRFVELEVIDRGGRPFATYVAPGDVQGTVRAYLLARRGERYRLRVHNPQSERLGVVIAVDGRNIISGARSELDPDEPMYVIGPHRTEVLSGWRTDVDHVQAFYFTHAEDSYAGAWDDVSAMGTIALAVFRERREMPAQTHSRSAPEREAPRAGGPPAAGGDVARESAGAGHDAGTGFGERLRSHSRRVHFVARRTPAFRHMLKYQWRSTLCGRGIVSCRSGNRFWPEPEYAPYPPGYRVPRW